MALPEPVLSGGDNIMAARRETHGPSKDPMKFVVLRAVASCLTRLGHNSFFDANIVGALAQKSVCFLHSYSLEVEEVHY